MVFLLCGTYVYVCRGVYESRRDIRGAEKEQWKLWTCDMEAEVRKVLEVEPAEDMGMN